MIYNSVALYSGWGPVELIRNPGDTFCHIAATKLLEPHLDADLINIRHSHRPVTDPWLNDCIIGGGTVLPTVFDKRRASGLLHSKSIYIFGSGCLSQREVDLLKIEQIETQIKHRFIPIGVRGPLSAQWFKEFYGLTIPWIGDLAFYFSQKTLPPTKTKTIAYYCIEDNKPSSRLLSHLEEIVALYNTTLQNEKLSEYHKIFYSTEDSSFIDIQQHLSKDFEYKIVDGATEYYESIISNDLVITERLHPAIIAACHGIPFIYLQTTSKSYDLEALFQNLQKDPAIKQLFMDMSKPHQSIHEKICANLTSEQLPTLLLDISSVLKEKLHSAARTLGEMIKNTEENFIAA